MYIINILVIKLSYATYIDQPYQKEARLCELMYINIMLDIKYDHVIVVFL